MEYAILYKEHNSKQVVNIDSSVAREWYCYQPMVSHQNQSSSMQPQTQRSVSTVFDARMLYFYHSLQHTNNQHIALLVFVNFAFAFFSHRFYFRSCWQPMNPKAEFWRASKMDHSYEFRPEKRRKTFMCSSNNWNKFVVLISYQSFNMLLPCVRRCQRDGSNRDSA